MKKFWALFVLSFLFSFPVFSQLHDNTWLIGGHGLGNQEALTNSTIVFDSIPPRVVFSENYLTMRQCGTVISDEEGNLLFSTNCHEVANANQELMANGDSINFNYNIGTQHYVTGSQVFQGAIALPDPSDDQSYYLIHVNNYLNSSQAFGTPLLFSKIDMSQSNGEGAVVQKNEVIISDTILAGGLTATRHANGRDWWVIVFKYNSPFYYRILVTDAGIVNLGLQETDVIIKKSIFGTINFSNDGKKLVVIPTVFDEQHRYWLEIFDFDRCTGILSNRKTVYYTKAINKYGNWIFNYSLGCSFSPNSRFLYVNDQYHTYQMDFWSNDPEGTLKVVADFDGFYDDWDSTYYWSSGKFGLSQLAPDGRIYTTTSGLTDYFHVTERPNNQGVRCKLRQHSLKTLGFNNYTVPNHPNYRLGPLEGSSCDTLGIEKKVFIHAHPYPNEGCIEGSTYFEVTAFGTGLQYQWQNSADEGVTWSTLVENDNFKDVNTNYLMIKGIQESYDGMLFRCVVAGNLNEKASQPAQLTVIGGFPVASLNITQDIDSLFFETTSTVAEYINWFFGDGDSSTLTNPTHLYTHAGTYFASIIATNACGQDTSSQEINIAPISAYFEADRITGCAPFVVNYTSKASYRSTPQQFQFYGGYPDWMETNLRKIPVLYEVPGIYDAVLKVFSPDSTEIDSLLRPSYITILEGINPTADISAQQTGNAVQLGAGFDFADTYTWYLSNGDTLMGQNVDYNFGTPGIYEVVLETANHCGAALDTVTFVVGDPGTAFSFGNTSGCGPLYLPFQNTSPFVADSVLWLFPGGSIPSATFDNPGVVYTASGTYEATMIAYIAGLADTVTQQFSIEIWQDECPMPQVFTQVSGLEVTVWTDCPGSPGFLWSMGDGSTFATQGITYQYDSTGVYNISLTVTGQCGGTATATTTVTVTVPSATGGQVQPTGSFSVFPNPASGQVFFSTPSPVSGMVGIQLLTATGTPVAELKKGQWSGTAAMPLSHLPAGLYFYEIQVDGQGVQQGKLVVGR